MNRPRHYLATALLSGAALALMAGCETAPTVATAPAATTPASPPASTGATRPPVSGNVNTPPPAPMLSPDQLALNEGIELYNKGSFNDAIKRLNGPEISAGTVPNQVAALKFTAFSYCVTKRQTLCRQQFEKAFKLDPAFELAQGEHGHPLWGKTFDRAKQNVLKPAPIAKPAPLKPAPVKPGPAPAIKPPATTPN